MIRLYEVKDISWMLNLIRTSGAEVTYLKRYLAINSIELYSILPACSELGLV